MKDVIVYTASGAAIFSDESFSEEAKVQNKNIRGKLEAMVKENTAKAIPGADVGLRMSTTEIWDVFFFVVPLTPPQIQEIEKLDNVDNIAPNDPVNVDGLTEGIVSEQPANVVPRGKRRRLKKREERRFRDRGAWEDLKFISTPEQATLSEAYSYYENDDSYYAAGEQRVTTILIGSGANAHHNEFWSYGRDLITLYMRGMDTENLKDDYTGIGTCLASKLVGPSYGVTKEMEIIVAKVAAPIASHLDMLKRVIELMRDLKKLGRQIRGYYVLTMGSHWPDSKDGSSVRFHRLISVILKIYEIVVVVPAGDDLSGNLAPIDEIPSIFSIRDGTMDVITVGAVWSNSHICPWSKGGDALTILAPGTVLCASSQAPDGDKLGAGTNVAAIQTAALAGYFLARPDIGKTLRLSQDGVPKAVKRWITTNCQEREVGNRVIWNLLGDKLS